jgi:hypothetical protein
MINNREIKDIIDTLLNSILNNNEYCNKKVSSIKIKCPDGVFEGFTIEDVEEGEYDTYQIELTFKTGEVLICRMLMKCCFLKVEKIPTPINFYLEYDPEPVRLVGKGKTKYHKQLIKEIKQAFVYKGLWQD